MTKDEKESINEAVQVNLVESIPGLQEQINRSSSTLTILPLRYTDDGRGVYGESSITLAKELRASGVDASFLDPVDKRVFEVKKGLDIALVQLAIFIAQEISKDLAWEGLKHLIRNKYHQNQKLEITYVHTAGDRTDSLQASGRRDGVLEALDTVINSLVEGHE